MARPSKLSEKEWNDLLKDHLSGESIRSVARKYDVAESAVRARISAQAKTIKQLANQIVDTETEIKKLPINAQCAVINLADELKAISMHLASAAKYGSMTAHRLSGIAHSEVQKIDDVNPLESLESMKGVAALTRLANDSAEIGLNLLKANKETPPQESDQKTLLKQIAERLPN